MSYTNPGPSITTGDVNILQGGPAMIGASSNSYVGFYGETPIVQRSNAAQATSLISGISTGAVSTNSLLLAAVIEVMNTLDVLGLWKGSS